MGLAKLQPRHEGQQGQFLGEQLLQPYDAKDFKAKNVACVVCKEQTFTGVLYALQNLGFEPACSSDLETVFKVVAEDPEDWAMIIVRLDQPLSEERLESYVRLIRMMDVRIPILVLAGKGRTPEDAGHPKLYGDCIVREPQTVSELSKSIGVAVTANRRWGSKFDDYRREALLGFRRTYY